MQQIDLAACRITAATGWRAGLKRAVGIAADVLLPPVCGGCGLGGTWMCDECAARAVRVDAPTACQRCGRPGSSGLSCGRCVDWSLVLQGCVSVYTFDDPIRPAIHRLKYQGEYARASWAAAELAAALADLRWQVDLLAPIPLHRRKLRQRGYNQSEKIAQGMGLALGIPVCDALERTRDTVSQTTLDRQQRMANVDGAFAPRYLLNGLHVVLIDDVVTTGSTLNSCAQACVDAGASSVRALTLATG